MSLAPMLLCPGVVQLTTSSVPGSTGNVGSVVMSLQALGSVVQSEMIFSFSFLVTGDGNLSASLQYTAQL